MQEALWFPNFSMANAKKGKRTEYVHVKNRKTFKNDAKIH